MKSKLSIITLSVLLCTTSLFAQKKVYLDIHGMQIKNEKYATYYRIIEPKGGSNYHLTEYYVDGKKYSEGEYVTEDADKLNGVSASIYRHGKYTRYHNDGTSINWVKEYERGAYHGVEKEYYKSSGMLEAEGQWNLGKPFGTWKYYDEEGWLERIKVYREDTALIDYTEYYDKEGNVKQHVKYIDGKPEGGWENDLERASESGDPATHKYIEQMPEAPYDVYTLIANFVKYPREAYKKGITGKANVRFVIDEEGNITELECHSICSLPATLCCRRSRCTNATVEPWQPKWEACKSVLYSADKLQT